MHQLLPIGSSHARVPRVRRRLCLMAESAWLLGTRRQTEVAAQKASCLFLILEYSELEVGR